MKSNERREKIIKKIKTNGVNWLFHRVKREIIFPTNIFVKNIIDFYLTIKLKINLKPLDDELIYGIYDLDINDITFNFGIFLVDLEYETVIQGKKGFVVVFIPKSSSSTLALTYQDYDSKIDTYSKEWRLNNLLLPLMSLSLKCRGSFFLPSRKYFTKLFNQKTIYPKLYDSYNLRKVDLNELLFKKLNKQGLVDGLQASVQGHRYINSWIKAKQITTPLVVITIRNSEFDPARNSALREWSKFAEYLLSKNFTPVFIPDTDSAFIDFIELKGYEVFGECAWNIGLRMALYEEAMVNFFAPNGCIVLAMFNQKCNYIAMNMLPDGSIVTTREAYKAVNHKIGENYKFANQRQKLCFKKDTFENIKKEFDLYMLENTQEI